MFDNVLEYPIENLKELERFRVLDFAVLNLKQIKTFLTSRKNQKLIFDKMFNSFIVKMRQQAAEIDQINKMFSDKKIDEPTETTTPWARQYLFL